MGQICGQPHGPQVSVRRRQQLPSSSGPAPPAAGPALSHSCSTSSSSCAAAWPAGQPLLCAPAADGSATGGVQSAPRACACHSVNFTSPKPTILHACACRCFFHSTPVVSLGFPGMLSHSPSHPNPIPRISPPLQVALLTSQPFSRALFPPIPALPLPRGTAHISVSCRTNPILSNASHRSAVLPQLPAPTTDVCRPIDRCALILTVGLCVSIRLQEMLVKAYQQGRRGLCEGMAVQIATHVRKRLAEQLNCIWLSALQAACTDAPLKLGRPKSAAEALPSSLLGRKGVG